MFSRLKTLLDLIFRPDSIETSKSGIVNNLQEFVSLVVGANLVRGFGELRALPPEVR
jgi:hypothetical protein